MKPYLIDNEPASSRDIIEKAQEYGYVGYRGVFFTSISAGVLREHGHKVENNKLNSKE